MGEIVLARTRRITIEQALQHIDRYPLTTLRLYDGGGPSTEHRFTPSDIGRVLSIEPLQQDVAVRLMELDKLDWSLVADDADLADADPEGPLYAGAAQVYAAVTSLVGVGDAIASKVLHLKRPAFFPVLDSVVRDLYRDASAAAYNKSTVWRERKPAWRRLYWAAVRADIVDPQNTHAVGELRGRLAADPTNERRTRAVSLTDVRLFDILAWS